MKGMDMDTRQRFTLCGIGALVMWSTIIGLMRSVTEAFGVEAGTALVYTVGAVALGLKNGIPPMREMSKIYLLGGGALFVLCEVALSQGVGLAESSQQTLEVGMLNYLWPVLIVVFSMLFNGLKLSWLVWPGVMLALAGLYRCVAASSGVSLAALLAHVAENPWPYACGVTAAVTWALYCCVSNRFSGGKNGMPVYFMVIALLLWAGFFMRGGTLVFPGLWPVFQLVLMGMVFGFSYSMWEGGMHHGNFMLLAVLSYFTPVGSMLFASLWLGILPPYAFWLGVGLTISGSLLCWISTLRQ